MAIAIVFTLCYIYQLFYLFIGLWCKPAPAPVIPAPTRPFGILIAARNEQAVIAHLLHTISKQTYDPTQLQVFVVADNCTDETASLCRSLGAVVYERHHLNQIGKGYALDFLIKGIQRDFGLDAFDGFFIFDADNLLDETYVYEMNQQISQGYRILTSYRNTKNYGTNWISAGYGLWFLREARFLNQPRMTLQTGCAISGTGFFVGSDVLLKHGGWPFHLLTEDIEFSVYHAITGIPIGYCHRAIFYDEQPETFSQSWKQRMRWTKGFYQVFGQYGIDLVKTIFVKGSFYAFDLFMTILPGMILTAFTTSLNLLVLLTGLLLGWDVSAIFTLLVTSLLTLYLLLFTFGLMTTLTEWHRLHTTPLRKVGYLFTFPLFMLTYLPIAICAMFVSVQWQPIAHTVSYGLDDLRKHTR